MKVMIVNIRLAKRAMLLVGAGKPLSKTTGLRKLFPKKTTWNFVILTDRTVNGIRARNLSNSKKREVQSLHGPNNMSGFCRIQMAMDSVS